MNSRLLAGVFAASLGACAGTPVPDWQLAAHGGLARASEAYLAGDTRVATAEFARARSEVARTGRVDLVARVELTRCAVQVASLALEPCAGFERLRADAPPAEQAYADHLQGQALDAARRALLPAPQQAAAAPGDGAEGDLVLLQGMADPMSRLVAAGVWLRSGRASPAVMTLAVETASAQGWRRPLLAWLGVLKQRAEQAGDPVEAARIARRIALVTGGQPTP